MKRTLCLWFKYAAYTLSMQFVLLVAMIAICALVSLLETLLKIKHTDVIAVSQIIGGLYVFVAIYIGPFWLRNIKMDA